MHKGIPQYRKRTSNWVVGGANLQQGLHPTQRETTQTTLLLPKHLQNSPRPPKPSIFLRWIKTMEGVDSALTQNLILKLYYKHVWFDHDGSLHFFLSIQSCSKHKFAYQATKELAFEPLRHLANISLPSSWGPLNVALITKMQLYLV